MDYRIDEMMLEWALEVQYLFQRGYTIENIEYGEAKFGLGPSVTLKKDGKIVGTSLQYDKWSIHDIHGLIRNLREEEEKKRWESLNKS